MKPLLLFTLTGLLVSMSTFAQESNIMSINRELRKEEGMDPLQWLKKNYKDSGRLTNAEMKCFKLQKAAFDNAMKRKEVQASLKKGKVPRMTYNLFSSSKEKNVHFAWDRPRRSGAMGGNYIIVNFGTGGGKCHINSADEIVAGAVLGVDQKLHVSDYKAHQGADQGSGEEKEYRPNVAFPNGNYGEPSPKMPAVLEPSEGDSVPATLDIPR